MRLITNTAHHVNLHINVIIDVVAIVNDIIAYVVNDVSSGSDKQN